MHLINPSVSTILNIKIILQKGPFEDILQLGQFGKMVVRPILNQKFEKLYSQKSNDFLPGSKKETGVLSLEKLLLL
jgi:hypothetical protein